MSLPVPSPPIFCAAVIFDPGGAQEYDLSGLLVGMRPLRQERDIESFGYRGSDLDLDFADPDGILIPENIDSPLRDPAGAVNWYGKKVLVAALMGADVVTRYVGFVLGVRNERGMSSLRLANRFQFFAEKRVLANQMGRVVAADGAVGVYPHIRPAGTKFVWGVRVNTVNATNARPCKVETWTFTFTSPTDWYVVGSETGFDGTGDIANGAWISDSGSIRILFGAVPFGFLGWQGGPFVAGDQVTVTTVYRTPIANERVDPAFQIGAPGNTANGTGQALADMLKAFLLAPQGGGATVGAAWPEPFALTAADLDPSIDALAGGSQDQPVVSYVVDSQKSVLDVMDEMALHLGVTLAEKSNGKIGAVTMMPRLVSADVPRELCKSDELMSAVLDHFQIQNEFLLLYDYDQTRNDFNRGFHHPRLQGFPAVANENTSFTKYGRLVPSSRAIELRAFEHANGNSWWVETIGALYYARLNEPRRIMSVRAKVGLLDADLDQVFRVESEAPTLTGYFEPYAISKNLTGELVTDMELASLEGLLQVGADQCGFLSYDTAGQGYDDCWGYL